MTSIGSKLLRMEGKRDMRRLLSTAAFLMLAGCAWDEDLNAGLDKIVGHPIQVAIIRMGMPDSEGQVVGRKFYAWNDSRTVSDGPTITTGTGTLDGKSFSYNQYSNQASGYSVYECKIRLFVDEDDIVRTYDWNGNLGGCRHYINSLED
jgi:hypothetical protein